MDAKLVFGLVVIITISCGNAEKVETDINVRQCNDSALKYVFVATLSGAHYPVDYTEGYEVFGQDLKDKDTNLLNSGAQESYNFGKFLAKEYGEKLAKSKDKLEEKFFRVYRSDYKRFNQTGQMISLGLQDQKITIDYQHKPADNYTTEYKTIKYIDGEEFVKFLDKNECPEYYNKMRTLRGASNVENEINSYLDKIKKKVEKEPWEYYNITTTTTVEPMVQEDKPSIVLPLLKKATREDAFKMMLLHETIQMKKRTGKRFEEQLGHWTDDDEGNIAKLTLWLGLMTGSKNDIKSLTAGRILDEVFKQMDNVRKGKQIDNHKDKNDDVKDVKLVVLPAPPMVLAGLIGTFNGVEFNNHESAFYPRQGALFVIELYWSCNGDVWFYKAKYKSQERSTLMEVTLPKVYDTNDVQTIFRKDVRNMLDNIRVNNSTHLDTLCKKGEMNKKI